MNPRVQVAGRGVVSPFGLGLAALVDSVRAGRSAVVPRRRTAELPAPTAVAAEIPQAVLAELDGPEPPLALARAAAREALAEAGDPDPREVSLVLATTKADLSGLEGPGDGLGLPARLAARLVTSLGLAGTGTCLSAACSSGLGAMALAARRLALGEERRVLVVGVDVLTHFVLAGFGSLHALDPRACRPFDARRRGISLGEAAAAVLLSTVPGEGLGVTVTGHGGANDAAHPTRPDPEGRGLALAAGRALRAAGLAPRDVDVIHLHGTGTRANDEAEACGLASLWDGRPTAPAFGTKAQTGHTLGAAGVLEVLLACDVLGTGRVPANVGLERPDVDPALDLVRAPRPLPRARRALKVGGGFGGFQSALVLEA